MSDDTATTGATTSESTNVLQASRDWLLLGGGRLVVSLGFAGLFLALFGGLMLANVFPFTNLQPVYYAYGAVISGNLTLITVAVSVNQLLLSRELSTPGELQDQIDEVIDYRREVEDASGRIAPVEPLGFLRLLVEATRRDAQVLGGTVKGGTATEGEERIDDVVTEVTDQMDRIDALLTEHSSSTIAVLSTMLATNYARQINSLRRVKHEYGKELRAPVGEEIDDLIERLQHLDVARQYFKTIYIKQELSSFSRLLLFAGLPAEAIAITALLLLTVPSSDPLAVDYVRLLVPVTLTVAVVPLTVLTSFVVRTATVNRRTAATVPFTAPEQER